MKDKQFQEALNMSNLLDLINVYIDFDTLKGNRTFLPALGQLMQDYKANLNEEQTKDLNKVVEEVFSAKQETLLKILQEQLEKTQK
jgi:hypothetical protein